MSRKQKLAEEWLKENEWDYQKYADKRGDQSAYDTRMLYEISDLLEWAFLAGYAACEQDAKVMEEALKDADLGFNTLYNHFICEDFIASGLSQRRRRIEVALAKWKERGE